MDEKDIKIEVSKNLVTIQGEKKSETEEKDKEVTYSRTISLPFEPDTNKTKTSFSKGILSVTIEKPEENISQSKMIPISTK